MGLCASSASPPPAPASKPAPSTNFGKPANLKKEDYIVKSRHQETIIRLPGEIAGQQFLIDGCTDCNIFLFDHSATVSVDDCKGCKIFIGPCESSLFVRDCSDCDISCAVQQFRSRDCKNVAVRMYTKTRPIIETSSGIRFGCLDLFYTDMRAQFDAARLDPWCNPWSRVHDFNAPDARNWSILPAAADPVTAAVDADLRAKLGLVTDRWLVPPTVAKDEDCSCFAVFFGAGDATSEGVQLAKAAVDAVIATQDAVVVQTKRMTLDSTMATALCKHGAAKGASGKARSLGPVIGLRITGKAGVEAVQGVLNAKHPDKSHYVLLTPPAAEKVSSEFMSLWGEDNGHRL